MKTKTRSKAPTPIPLLDPRQRYSIDEACALLRQSRAKLYIDIKNGRIETFRDGGRIYVSGRSILQRSLPPGEQSQAEAA